MNFNQENENNKGGDDTQQQENHEQLLSILSNLHVDINESLAALSTVKPKYEKYTNDLVEQLLALQQKTFNCAAHIPAPSVKGLITKVKFYGLESETNSPQLQNNIPHTILMESITSDLEALLATQ